MSRSIATKRTILCVDNDRGILRYEKVLLERSGYAVITAASAQQALRLVTMCKCDAVLLDYEMPEMNGDEIAFEIRRMRPELVIILLSGSEVPTHALTRVDAFVPKRNASRELVTMLADLCSRTRQPQQRKEAS